MKRISLVMTLIGRDRPGLVESIARVIAEHGGNWEESRMSHLAGQFAGILRVLINGDRAGGLVGSLRDLGREGDLELVIHPDAEDAPQRAGRVIHLELVGQDRPGIIRQLAQTIAREGFNVEELSSECCGAPMSGGMLFRAKAKLTPAEAASIDRLREQLERTAADLMVDIHIEES